MSTDATATAECPDACPKGHRIWWFEHGHEYRGTRDLHWGLCAGKINRDGFIVAQGACRYVWCWDGDTLKTVYEFNGQRLAHHLREAGHQMGLFTGPRAIAPESGDA